MAWEIYVLIKLILPSRKSFYFNRQISGFVWKKKGNNMRISIRMIIAISFYGTAMRENAQDAYVIRHFFFMIIN